MNFHVREIPNVVHAALMRKAKQERRSMNNQILLVLEEYTKRIEKEEAEKSDGAEVIKTPAPQE